MTLWTLLGQTINFVIFVVILYYLIYRPVGRILKQRKEEQEAELRKAQELRAEAEKQQAEVEKRERELTDSRDGILEEARARAEQERKEILKSAEDKARAKLERFRRVMQQERDDLLAKVSAELRKAILQIANAIVGADMKALNDRAIERVEALLKELSPEDAEAARKALDDGEQRVHVRAASSLNDEERERLTDLIAKRLDVDDDDIRLEVSEDPSLVAGIEVAIGHVNLNAHWGGVIDEALKKQEDRSVT